MSQTQGILGKQSHVPDAGGIAGQESVLGNHHGRKKKKKLGQVLWERDGSGHVASLRGPLHV